MKPFFKIFLYFLVKGASLPVRYKGGIISRVLVHFFERRKKNIPGELKTYSNYGIDNRLHIELPMAAVPAHLLYGAPVNYIGEYNTLLLAGILNRHSSAFIDVGANWGYYTYFMATAEEKQGPIYSFEPNPFLFEYLKKNVRQNNLEHVHPCDLAVGDTSGTITFYKDIRSDLSSTISPPENLENFIELEVKATRLDDWIRQLDLKNILVKADVENAEWNLIRGATGVLDRIVFLVMEVLGPARKSGFIHYMIRELNWHAYYINRDKIEHVTEEDMRYTPNEYNWLFCKTDPQALRQLLYRSGFTVVA